jgi:Orsellinic acid/F9775 biosynthesis cluster protein D
MEAYVQYNAEFKLAICTSCEQGLSAQYILRHFQDQHGSTFRIHRKALIAHISSWELTPVKELHYPDSIREPVEGIKVLDGWICEGNEECFMCCVSEEFMRKHCAAEHGWNSKLNKMWAECRVQTLLGKPHIKYFTL